MIKRVGTGVAASILAVIGLLVAQVAAGSPRCDGTKRSPACRTTTAATTTSQDVVSPSVPTALTLSDATSSSVSLLWAASTDDVGVSGYRVLVDGVKAGTTSSTHFAAGSLSCGSTFTFAVVAFDAAGNESAPATVTGSSSACSSAVPTYTPPYDPTSAWNTPISANPTVDAKSDTYINAIADNGLPLTSDPDQYTIAVWTFDALTPRYTVKVRYYFSTYDSGDNSKVSFGYAPTVTGIPVPVGAVASKGNDGQIVFWDPVSGIEYGFGQWSGDPVNGFTASYGYRYHTTSGNFGRFADGGTGPRGAGTSYLAGLVLKREIAEGRIDHALTFGYHAPSPEYVYPASKSDGGQFGGVAGIDVPEGKRLQLNPALTDAQLAAYGLNASALVIARALQRYGAIVVDNSGSSKIYLEDRASARWDTTISRSMLSNIPWSQFRVVK